MHIVFGFGRVYVCLMNVSVLYPYRLHLHYVWMSAVSTSALMDRWCCIIPLSTADTTSVSHSAACWVHRSRSTQTPAAHCGSAHVRHAHRALSFALDGRCLYLCYFSSSYILLQHLFIFFIKLLLYIYMFHFKLFFVFSYVSTVYRFHLFSLFFQLVAKATFLITFF